MQVLRQCKLCLAEKSLLESHFISRKLYYSGKKRLEFSTRMESGSDPGELKAHLLCFDCEQRFSDKGESDVLHHVSPKYMRGFPLHERMRVAYARDHDPTLPRFAAYDFSIDTGKFAYFAFSIVWRRTIHEWVMGSTVFPRWELGESAEQMRTFLLGETVFPPDTSVIVIVCSDEASRKTWTIPASSVEEMCLNFAFQVRGIYFRVMMGRHMPQWSREASCLAAWKPTFYGDCASKTTQGWNNLALARAAYESVERFR